MASITKEVIFTKEECKTIQDYILKKETDIKNLGDSIYPGTSPDALTGRYHLYNFFNSHIAELLKFRILNFLKKQGLKKPCAIQCWANTFRKNEGIKKHNHGGEENNFKSANIFIAGDPNIGTHFIINNKNIKISNTLGEIVLFDCHMEHWVDPNPNDDIRISMALDIHEKLINIETTRYYNWI